MGHVVLLGDSIFDNARYVPGGPSVIEHLRRGLPAGWRATLLARDGAVAEDVARQLANLPGDATHLVVSAGGNDCLGHGGLMFDKTATTFEESLAQLGLLREQFRRDYRAMLLGIRAAEKPTTVCTVYDAIPILSLADRAALSVFNEVILHEAARAGVPVIDLRVVCSERSDYAPSSPIEPSVAGGGKIARAVARVVAEQDFAAGGCRIYV